MSDIQYQYHYISGSNFGRYHPSRTNSPYNGILSRPTRQCVNINKWHIHLFSLLSIHQNRKRIHIDILIELLVLYLRLHTGQKCNISRPSNIIDKFENKQIGKLGTRMQYSQNQKEQWCYDKHWFRDRLRRNMIHYYLISNKLINTKKKKPKTISKLHSLSSKFQTQIKQLNITKYPILDF
jgi:hypothetical protein